MERDDELDYYSDLVIDTNNIGEEWLQQPLKYARYSDLAARAEAEWMRAVEHKKTVRSTLILRAQEGGEDFLGFKPTEKAVEAWYRTQKQYIDAKEEEIAAFENKEILRNAMFSINMRKGALENTVKLVVAGFYATPVEPRQLQAVASEIARSAAVDKIRNRMRSKRDDEEDDDLATTPKRQQSTAPASRRTKPTRR